MAWVVTHPDGGRAGRERARSWLAAATGEAGSDPEVECCRHERLSAVEACFAARGWRWLVADEAEFPPRLCALADPPLGLFVRGALPVGKMVAIVGARKASAYGKEVAEILGRELGRAGVVVISGMARGVDGAAHRGSLAAGGVTVAVWGAGPDRVYPAEHEELAAEIAATGCLITEYPPGAPPLPQHFPERNRLIAGLADVVVVVEADERSGALITARQALDEGRDVMAVPGSIFSRLSAGPNGLLRAGAAPVLSADDILAACGLPPARIVEPVETHPLLAHIAPGVAVSVDQLAAASALPVAQVLEQLLTLELAGAVTRESDGRVRRSRLT